jgi:hypothetical protein
VKRWGGVLCFLVLSSFLSAPAFGKERGLAFRDNRALSLTLAEARAGRTVSLCNSGVRDALAVDPRLEDFAFKHDKAAVPDEVILLAPREQDQSPSGRFTLVPGDCVSLTVKARADQPLDAGAYAGVLSVSSASAGLVRLNVTITVDASPKVIKPTGAVTDAPLRANRDGPFGRPFGGVEMEDAGKLPLKAPKAGEKLELPAPGTFVGSIYNGTERARVYVADADVVTRADAWFLPLRVESVDEVGDYAGKLDIAGSGKDDEAVAVKLSVTDDVEWALLALVLGALLPVFVVQLPLQRWRPQIGLWWHRRQLPSRYEEAGEAFKQLDTDSRFSGFARPSDERISAYTDAAKANTKRYARSVVFFDVGTDAYKALVTALRQAEDDGECLGAKDGLYQSLDELDQALDELIGFCNQNQLSGRTPPRLARTAEALMTGKELEVGEATARADAADDFVKFIGEWKAMAQRARDLELWLRLVAQAWDRMPDEDRASLERAAVSVAEAKLKLSAAPDRGALDDVRAQHNLDGAYERIAYLAAKYHRPQPEAGTPLTQFPVQWGQFALLAQRDRLALDLAGASQLTRDEIRLDLPEIHVSPAVAGAVIKGLRWTLDLAILGASAIIGAAAGLSTLYFGKTFGTDSDYWTAILVGASSQVLSKAVLDAVTQMRAQDTEPVEAASPAPATATAKG